MEDILNRQPFIEDVKTIIKHYSEKKKNITFAIDGKWGIGKTFLLGKLEEQLKNDYVVFHYNAWEYDYYEEPLIALITSTIEQLGGFLEYKKTTDQAVKAVLKKAKNVFVKVLGEFCKNKLGVDIPKVAQELYDDVKSQKKTDKAYDKNIDVTEKIREIKKALEEVSKIRTIVFVVDEIDRCLPEYAIKVLERLHHVFSGVENLQAILSIDKNQLNNTIRTIFGKETDKDGYLKKFISFTMELSVGEAETDIVERVQPNYYKLFKVEWLTTKIKDVEEFIEGLLSSYDMRTRLAFLEKAACLHDMLYKKGAVCDFTYMCLELLLIVCQREGGLYKGKEGKVVGDGPFSTFLSLNEKFSFFNEKIEETRQRSSEKKRYHEKREITGFIGFAIEKSDIWAIIWIVVCFLYGDPVLDYIFINPKTGAPGNSDLEKLHKYAEEFLRICEMIE